MVGPGVYSGRTKSKEVPHSYDATSTYSKTKDKKAVPLIDHPLPTNVTLKFDTNVKLQRNTVLATVTILNVFVTVALIAAAVPTGAYIQRELNSSQHKIVVLQEQVKYLTDRYDYVLKQLRSVRIRSKRSSLNENLNHISNNVNSLVSAQHTFPTQYKDVNSLNNGERSQHIQTGKPSFMMNDNTDEEHSTGALANEEAFAPPTFSEEPPASREVAMESDGTQYETFALRRTKRSDSRGAAVAHFKGGQPETFIRDGGLVAPWFLDDAASGRFGLSSFQLKQGKAAIEVTESGLYYIYSQIHYLTSQVTNSYSLNLRHGSQSNSSVLSYCSASSGSQTLNEVSCFTSVVRYLNATDRVFIQQRDMNRRIILRDGYSYFGVVRLST